MKSECQHKSTLFIANDTSVAMFAAFAIEQYAHFKNMPVNKVVTLLTVTGVLDRIVEFYDVLHQQDAHWLVEEIDNMLIQPKEVI